MQTAPATRPLATLAIVLAAAWIAIGAGYKWLGGSPNDLPALLHVDFLDLGLVYRLAIGIELAVVATALLAPRIGWFFLALQYLAFVGILVALLLGDAESCGCFGSSVTIHPGVMLAIDGALLAGVLATRPWSKDLWVARAPLVFAAVALALAAPWLYSREIKAPRNGAPASGFVFFDEVTWAGRPLGECDFVPYLDTVDGVESLMPGTWVFYRQSCPHCADHLRLMHQQDQFADTITLVLIPEPDLDPAAVVVDFKPVGEHVTEVSLKAGIDYVMEGPVDLRVEWADYLVSRVRTSEELAQPGASPFPTADPAILEAAAKQPR